MFFPGRSTIWSFLVVLAVFWIVGCGQKKGDGGKTPDPLPESILSEWRKAGFQSGWFSKDERGYLHFGAGSPKAGDVPGFTIETWPKGGLVAKLTPPPQPFGVHLHNTTGVTNDTLKELAGMKELQVLTLGRSVGDESTKELAGMTGLQTLDLSTSKVSDAGLKELARMSGLQWLHLGDAPVTDTGLKELAGLKGLKWLHFYKQTKVTDKGMKELQDALQNCKVIKS